jgi:hypothetical protein
LLAAFISSSRHMKLRLAWRIQKYATTNIRSRQDCGRLSCEILRVTACRGFPPAKVDSSTALEACQVPCFEFSRLRALSKHSLRLCFNRSVGCSQGAITSGRSQRNGGRIYHRPFRLSNSTGGDFVTGEITTVRIYFVRVLARSPVFGRPRRKNWESITSLLDCQIQTARL